MKTILLKSIICIAIASTVASCGSAKKAANADKKKQEQKQKSDQLDQDKKRFEMQNNKDLK